MPAAPLHVVYVTTGSREEALSLGRALVEEGLVACVNVFDGVTSIYRWEGALQEDGEVVLICKTVGDRVDAVIARVRSLHSYDCPAVTAWPIEATNPEYAQWVAAAVK